eukprot:scaffold128395_cov28-Prasinocladus_malaysianus.AAC.1
MRAFPGNVASTVGTQNAQSRITGTSRAWNSNASGMAPAMECQEDSLLGPEPSLQSMGESYHLDSHGYLDHDMAPAH